MKIPNKKHTKKIIKKVLKKEGVKLINTTSRWHRKKRKFARVKFLAAGIEKIDELLESRYMYISYKGRDYILTPRKLGTGNASQRVNDLATIAHELTHKEQCHACDNAVEFYSEYILKKGARALYEARAEAAGSDTKTVFGVSGTYRDNIFDDDWVAMYHLDQEHANAAAIEYYRLMTTNSKFVSRVSALVCNTAQEVCK